MFAALKDADWQRCRHHLERVDQKMGQVYYEPGRAQRHAHFPTSGVVSLLAIVELSRTTYRKMNQNLF